MVILFQDIPGGTARTGGSVQRSALWRYIEERFPDAEKIIVRPQDFTFWGYVKRTIWLLTYVVRSRNKIYLVTYPSYFPFGPIHSPINLLVGTVFWVALKVVNRLKSGMLLVWYTDIPLAPQTLPKDGYGRSIKLSITELCVMSTCERIILRLASQVWTTSEGFKDHLVLRRVVRPDKVKASTNGTDRHGSIIPALERSSQVRFLYAGNLSQDWGLIEVIGAFRETPLNAELILCGFEGEWMAEEIAGNERIRFLGWLSDRETIAVAKGCDVGLIPYPPLSVSPLVFPTKLALYITCGLAVLTTAQTESARIVGQHNMGLSYEEGCLASYMALLAEDRDLLRGFQKNCQKVAEEYYWDTIFDRLFQGIVSLRPK